jgi:N-methylhydantoinase A
MRYHGQSYEIETVLDPEAITRGDVDMLANAFHERHRQVYDHADHAAPVQVINLRLVVIGKSPKPRFPASPERRDPAVASETRRVFLDGKDREVPVFARDELRAGQFFEAPAIVTQSDCTTCIPGGFAGRVDAYGNLILALAPGAE